MEFRRDIQIYRGIAVLAVVLFHLGLGGFEAGFLGVDIFFVISGFLMQMLYTEQSTWRSFYQRRARRLLPAYFATILTTLVASAVFVLPSEFSQAANQALWSVFFVPNIGYWAQNSYFSKSDFNPLLNLWSLGVELQFYLILPALAFLTRNRTWLLIAVCLVSLALCLLAVTISPKTPFFLAPFRIWQFGAGMLAARFAIGSNPKLGLLCSVLMLASLFLPVDGSALSPIVGHPGLGSIVATLATAGALIWGLPTKVTTSAAGTALLKLGNVSYSIYLAHFPALVLLHYRPFSGTILGYQSALHISVSIALIGACSFILYMLFERHSVRLFSWRNSALTVAAVAALAITLPSFQLVFFPDRDQKIFKAFQDRAPYRCGKLIRITQPKAEICAIGEAGVPILLIGDSHADAIKVSFAKVSASLGQRPYFAVSNAPLLSDKLKPDWLARQAKVAGAKTIYLHYSPDNARKIDIPAIKAVAKSAGLRVIWIKPIPVYRASVPELLYRQAHEGMAFVPQSLAAYSAHNQKVSNTLSALGIPTIDLAPVLCAPDCRVQSLSGELYYFDDGHLTLTGAAALERGLRDQMSQFAAL
ncbi:acyltransferase [Sphingobium yanoikuyae]|uniref:Acyltransferase n=1 Tax=Sphingobium yanoikuyae TaxID=13690 RepID=A0A6M4G0V6_SPHYA|nr:acyltransferase family protein [Sphingobium yanoikuyae]QJR00868.1 acyltransferase [Sphingobium yanoikuyae]